MAFVKTFVFFISIGAAAAASVDFNRTLHAPKPNVIYDNIDEKKLSDEIREFTNYRCEKMIVIRNKAEEEFKVFCEWHFDNSKRAIIQPGNAYAFTVRPEKNGRSVYWCTVEYKKEFARFDVYNEDLLYTCLRDMDEVVQYVVTNDGVYIDKSQGRHKGQKIRSLVQGQNKFVLWEQFEHGDTDGYMLTGFVDGGICYDLPKRYNDRPAAVTICQNQCVYLWADIGCQGKVQKVQANGDCQDFGLSEELKHSLTSIQGC